MTKKQSLAAAISILRFTLPLVLSLVIGANFAIFSQDNESKPKLNSQSKLAREYALSMLDEIKGIMKENYFDQNYGGMDLKARIETAKARVKTLELNWQMYRVIAQVLLELDDSHTFFILPRRGDHFRYGISWQMFGNKCLITSVKKDSDAFAQGLEVGDQVVAIRKLIPTRADLWKITYVILKLDPSQETDLRIRKPDGTERSLTIKAKTSTDKEYQAELKERREKLKARKEKDEYQPFKCQEASPELLACKLETFIAEKPDIDKMMKRASKYPKLILDLRQNHGGYVFLEEYVLSHFFDHEVKVADRIARKKTETSKTKVMNVDRQYKGEVSVLIDSESASASEITARVLQLEKRAKIYGDFSRGAVMTSITMPFTDMLHYDTVFASNLFAMSVTVGDVVMSDGSRLEKVGIVPDFPVRPTPIALKQKWDPVLAFAAGKMGVTLTPEDAGKFYFITEKPGDDDEADATDR